MELTRTTTVLLEGLRDAGNAAAWEEFDRRYRPLIIGFCRRLGLSETDAADVAQETLSRFVGEYRDGRYDRKRGRLRTWLIALARSRLAEHRRQHARRREVRGESAMVNLDDDESLSSLWEEERRMLILRHALDELHHRTRMDARTIEAFELLVLRQMPVTSVAERLGLSSESVYLAKSRVAGRLREIIAREESIYEDEAA